MPGRDARARAAPAGGALERARRADAGEADEEGGHHPPSGAPGPTEANATVAHTNTVALVNRASGGCRGGEVAAALRERLGAGRVFDLAAPGGAPAALARALALDDAAAAAAGPGAPRPGLVVLACGGDGTFNWVSTCLAAALGEAEGADSARSEASSSSSASSGSSGSSEDEGGWGGEGGPPGLAAWWGGRPVAVVPVPLGTSNDLAGSLGWGRTFAGVGSLLRRLNLAAPLAPPSCASTNLDLWRCAFRNRGGAHGMLNYFSVGVDALGALRFQERRSTLPAWAQGPTLNKLLYAILGGPLAFRGAASLDKRLVLEIDGAAVPVPRKTKSILVLNIPAYADGTHPWGEDRRAVRRGFGVARIDDGLVEVLALKVSDPLRPPFLRSFAQLPRGGGGGRPGIRAAADFLCRSPSPPSRRPSCRSRASAAAACTSPPAACWSSGLGRAPGWRCDSARQTTRRGGGRRARGGRGCARRSTGRRSPSTARGKPSKWPTPASRSPPPSGRCTAAPGRGRRPSPARAARRPGRPQASRWRRTSAGPALISEEEAGAPPISLHFAFPRSRPRGGRASLAPPWRLGQHPLGSVGPRRRRPPPRHPDWGPFLPL